MQRNLKIAIFVKIEILSEREFIIKKNYKKRREYFELRICKRIRKLFECGKKIRNFYYQTRIARDLIKCH